MGRPCSEVAQGVHGFATDIAIRVGEEPLGERPDLLAVLGQDPEGLDAAGGRSGGIFGDGSQRGGGSRFGATIGERLPGEMRIGGYLGTQASDKVSGRELGIVRHHLRNEALRLDTPDATRLLIAVGVVAGDLVMADDLVIPVDDVEAAIRTHRHRDRTEERVVAGDEIIKVLEAITGALAVLADRVDLRGDRVGDIHHAVVTLRPDADVGEGETAEASATHLEIRRLDRERRLIGFSETIRATGIKGVFVERHHRVAVVIGLLDERLAFAGQDETPDITRSRRSGLEDTPVGTEARHACTRKIRHLALGRGDLAGIKGTLREPEPTERCARELVWEKM